MAGLTAAELEAVIGVDDSPFARGLDGMLSKFEGWGGKAGAVLAGAGALGGGLFAAGVAGGLSLDEARGRMQAELGLSAKESERLGGVAGNLYADAYGENIGEVSNAVSVVVSSIKGMRNASDAELEAMTATAMDFANVFEVDVAKAAQVAGIAVQTGLAKNGVEAFDMLTAAMQKVPKQLREDVLDATEEYSQFFAGLGIEGEQAFAMLAQGAEKGMYGIDKVGDAVKEFTIRSTDMSTASKDAYKAIGLNAGEMANAILAGGDKAAGATQKVIDGLLALPPGAKQANAAIALFGTPLEDLGTKDIPKFLQSLSNTEAGLGNFEGAAARAGKAINDNARTNLTSFTRQLQQGLVTVIGGAVVPLLNDMSATLAASVGPALSALGTAAGVAGAALGSMAGFVQDNATVFAVVAGVIASLFIPHLIALGVQSTIAGVKSAAAWTMTQAGAIKAAVLHSATVVRMVAGWVLMGAQSMAQAARMAAAWVIAMGPIGWAIAAVVALVALVVANWDKVKAATVAAWQAVSKAVGVAWDWIKGAVSTAVAAVKSVVSTGFAAIKAAVTTYVNAWKTVITTAWAGIKAAVTAAVHAVKAVVSAVFGAIKAVVSTTMNGAKAVIAAVWGAIKAVVTTGVNVVKTVVVGGFNALKQGVMNAWNNIKTAVQGGIGGVLDLVKSLPGRLVSALGNLGSLLFNAGKELIGGFIDGIKSMLGAVGSAASSVASKIKGFFPGSPVKEGPLTSWNNGGAGKRLADMLATGLLDGQGPVDDAARRLSERVKITPADAAFEGARLGAQQRRQTQPTAHSGQLFGDVYLSDEADVDMLMSRAGFALSAGVLGG